MDLPNASPAENIALFKKLVGDLAEWKKQLAPDGWPNCPYYFLYHPTAEMRYEKAVDIHENFEEWLDDKKLPEREEFQEETLEDVNEDYELKDLLGRCLWTIFSNNHEVINSKGEVHDTGSFRGSGRFIAEFLNQHYPSEKGLGYLDFYCADLFFSDKIDIRPIYGLLFAKLKMERCDWKYYFPRTHLISFAKPEQKAEQIENYDPTQAMQEQLKKEEKRKTTTEFQRMLNEDYEQRREEAKYQAPPVIVQAYHKVYGNLLLGYVEE